MRIAYVANHAPIDNQDEAAIAHALTALGHTVVTFDEKRNPPRPVDIIRAGPDFLLTHKFEDFATLRYLPCPKAFFFFDLIENDDWHLQARSAARKSWLAAMTEVCDLGFLTDGDAVSRDRTGKLHWLMQGADERVMGPGTPKPPAYWGHSTWTGEILFTGSTIHGGKRITFVEEMTARYGNRFLAFGHHPKERVHGRQMADLIASAKIVVAPDGPISNRYWSNRVYQALGFGAFLMHPYCAGLADQYLNTKHLFFYRDRPGLYALVDDLLQEEWDATRTKIAIDGYNHTRDRHTYRHRCAELMETVRTKLNIDPRRWGDD